MEIKPDPQQILTCFVVMPFTDTEHVVKGKRIVTSASEWDHIYDQWIKKAVESFSPHKFRCIRSPALPGNFIKGIVQDLFNSDVVIADLTGNRPNVYYELGIRHALQPGTLIITQDITALPSDLRSYYCFEYAYEKEHYQYEQLYNAFQFDLHQKLDHFFENLFGSDNPVSDFLGYKNAFLDERFQYEKQEVVYLATLARNLIKENFEICAEFARIGKHLKSKGSKDFSFRKTIILDFFPFDLLLSRLVNTRWELMPFEMIQNLTTFVTTVRLQFLPIHQGWQALQVNPQSPIALTFFDLASAPLEHQKEQERVLDLIVTEAEKLNYTVSIGSRRKS